MAGDVHVPGVGKVKKGYALAGGALLVGIVGYAWYRHSKTAGATTATAAAAPSAYGSGDPYPPDGTSGNPSDPNSLDPASGMTYGDEGGGSYAGAGYGYYGSPAGGYPGAAGSQFTDNAQWAQYAEDYLVNQTAADPNTVAAALGKYLTGGTLTPEGQTVVNSAIAFAGFPPVAGPQGYPPSMHVGQAAPAPPPAPAPSPVPATPPGPVAPPSPPGSRGTGGQPQPWPPSGPSPKPPTPKGNRW